jgi:hypothetical protein
MNGAIMQLQHDISDGEKDYARAEPPWIVCALSPGAQMMNHCLPFVLSLTAAQSEKVAPTIIMNEVAKNYILADGFFCNGDVILPDADWKSDALAQQLSILITSFLAHTALTKSDVVGACTQSGFLLL